MKRSLSRGLLSVAALSLAATLATPASAKTEITLSRFFGACDAEYGNVNDVSKASGECGIITTLVNQFNATNKEDIVVKPQIIEWGPYYTQIDARILSHDVPTISVMHEAVLGDYVKRNLVEPLDDGFKSVGIDKNDFTGHAHRGVTFGDKTYALPFDTHSWLWHINVNLFKKAGLVDANGKPILPKTPDELLAQAKQFKDKTGLPYFTVPIANEAAAQTRSFDTWVYQQNGTLFPSGPTKIDMHSPAATNALSLYDKLMKAGDITPGLDYGAANQAFENGKAGVLMCGTWVIEDFTNLAKKPDSTLANDGYEVVPFPNLFQKKAVWADGHSWIMLKGGAKDEKTRHAALVFLKFLYDHDGDWARTGHLPARQSIIDSAAFNALPHRSDIKEISSTGYSLPNTVPRQFAIQQIVGEEISNMLSTGKPLADVQKDAEDRTNKLLAK
ncbi:extracellular solute-binding protein [Pararobbsia silviterrae]|uniref:Extracellular solute-binding protein n=1 Tax=Pararobbsia silviterrae TaxID=1792498 RepID=A0A494XVG4_9BURK|nr:extracellular solute-binding protein [Pararobbsia silviterrae]RKP54613.1 extracellular solute-binding protein [Pararobbsia silviterrae]